jgi:hypothetical protein
MRVGTSWVLLVTKRPDRSRERDAGDRCPHQRGDVGGREDNLWSQVFGIAQKKGRPQPMCGRLFRNEEEDGRLARQGQRNRPLISLAAACQLSAALGCAVPVFNSLHPFKARDLNSAAWWQIWPSGSMRALSSSGPAHTLHAFQLAVAAR